MFATFSLYDHRLRWLWRCRLRRCCKFASAFAGCGAVAMSPAPSLVAALSQCLQRFRWLRRCRNVSSAFAGCGAVAMSPALSLVAALSLVSPALSLVAALSQCSHRFRWFVPHVYHLACMDDELWGKRKNILYPLAGIFALVALFVTHHMYKRWGATTNIVGDNNIVCCCWCGTVSF